MNASRAITALATGTLAVGLFPAPAAHAAFPGHNGRIAFVRQVGGGYAIYTIHADGSSRHRLTRNGDAQAPKYSPSGHRIAYVVGAASAKSDIWTMRANGHGQKPVVDDPSNDESPSWSPDGSQIVFTSDRSGVSQLYVVSLATGQTRQLPTAAEPRSPAWSPDGRLIAFQGRVGNELELFTVHADGTGVAAVTHTTALELTPSWSPNGKRLVYGRAPAGGQCASEVWVIHRNGTKAHRLLNFVCDDWQPAWSPDGRRIALRSDGRDPFGAHPKRGIWTVHPNKTHPKFLRRGVDGFTPDWQPTH